MPDSFPPFGWGPVPFDERDLDALLSGETADVPMALRQVADALTALRAAPTLAELSGESAIIAEFSALAEFRALEVGQASRDGGQAHTLVLPVQPSHVARRRGARHRRPAHRVTRRTGTLMAAAAAVLIIAGVTVTGHLPGSSHSRQSAATSTSAGRSAGNSASPGLQAKGAQQDRSHPAPSPQYSATVPPQPEASELCHTLFGLIAHPGQNQQGNWPAEEQAFQALSKLAHDGHLNVTQYCGPYLRKLFPNGIPSHLLPQDLGQSDQGNGDSGQGNEGARAAGQPNPTARQTPPHSSNAS